MTFVADYVLQRLAEWGVQRVYGCPGDGINGLLGAFDRARGEPEFIQTRHEETAAFMACAHAKFTGEVGKVGNGIAPIPPHIMASQGKKAAKAALHDPDKAGITARGVRQKITEYAGRLPGRGEK